MTKITVAIKTSDYGTVVTVSAHPTRRLGADALHAMLGGGPLLQVTREQLRHYLEGAINQVCIHSGGFQYTLREIDAQ